MHCLLIPPHAVVDPTKQRGFGLIEAVIVLGLVGLVIGGIWIAAQNVVAQMRVTETAQGILNTAMNARRLLPYHSYPTTPGTGIYIGSTLNAANAYPPGFRPAGNMAISPAGVRIEAHQSCWSICPMLGISLRGPGDTVYPTTLKSPECVQLIRRFAGIARDNSEFLYVQITVPGNSNYLLIYPPIDPALVNCPADFTTVVFWFKP